MQLYFSSPNVLFRYVKFDRSDRLLEMLYPVELHFLYTSTYYAQAALCSKIIIFMNLVKCNEVTF